MLNTPSVTTLLPDAVVPGDGTRVKANLPVTVVSVSVSTVIVPSAPGSPHCHMARPPTLLELDVMIRANVSGGDVNAEGEVSEYVPTDAGTLIESVSHWPGDVCATPLRAMWAGTAGSNAILNA